MRQTKHTDDDLQQIDLNEIVTKGREGSWSTK